jgi:hypothetical protein
MIKRKHVGFHGKIPKQRISLHEARIEGTKFILFFILLILYLN